jgi:RNA polymerase sigma-70 factor (ECF subfamily)
VLILRDVLRWTAAETAEALETTSAAVNSALQRAHAVMADKQPEPDTVSEELSPAQKVLLDQYVDAFWRKDIDAIVGLLKHEAVWEMPPFTGWYVGAENIGKLISVQCPGGVHDMVMLPATANGQPGFALYMRSTSGDPDSDFVPFHLQVLDLEGDRVRHVAAFFEKGLFEKFGLPARLPADSLPSGARAAGAGGR